MSTTSKLLLITGATGKQGGAVVDALLNLPSTSSPQFSILAVTRDPSSPSAQRLASKSATIRLLKGDYADIPALFRSASEITKAPIWGVFAVQAFTDSKVEEAQGKAFVDEAVKAGVKQYVYASVERGGDEKSWADPTNVPHFTSKHHIEHHLRDSTANQAGDEKMSWTILRPTTFLDGNIVPGFQTKVFMSALWGTLGQKPLQFISTKDIGWFGAQAFLRPDVYRNRAIGLAGDTIDYASMERIFKAQTGQAFPMTYGALGSALRWGVKEVRVMLDWFKTDGFGVDVKALRKVHPGLMDFETWLEKESAWKKR